MAYAIGVAHPLSVSIFHYGTSQKSEQELLNIVAKNFDLRPGVIVRYPDVVKSLFFIQSWTPTAASWAFWALMLSFFVFVFCIAWDYGYKLFMNS